MRTTEQKRVISVKLGTDSGKICIKFRKYFEWTINVNNEKGSAGGNMKLDLPIRSSFLMGVVCLTLSGICAYTGLTAYLVPAILLYFAIHHFIHTAKRVQGKLLSKAVRTEVKPACVN